MVERYRQRENYGEQQDWQRREEPGQSGRSESGSQGSDSWQGGSAEQRPQDYSGQGGYGPQGGQSSQSHGQGGYGSQGGQYSHGGFGSQRGSERGQASQNSGQSGGYGGQDFGQQAGFGGYGPQAGGYGSQSSYAAHGGYGSQGQRSQGGYGSEGELRSQGYGTHAGYGSQGGYGPQGNEHWPQALWDQQKRSQRRGPKGYKRSDERIKEDLCERLMHSAHIDASEVTLEVKDGNVSLEGTVPERRMKHAIEDMADACSGVNDVENKLRVSQAGSQDSSTGGSSGVGGQASNTSPAGKAKKE